MLAAPLARGQDLAVRPVRITERDGRILASFDVLDLLDRPARRKLRSGIPTHVVVRAYLYGQSGGAAALAARTCRVVFDLWEETYTVIVTGAGVNRKRRTVAE